MKLKFNGFLALLLVLITQITFAQDIAVTGVVQDQTGMPVPGANVLVKGTTNGVQTDFDGKFKISAAKGQVLVFSFLGMKTQEAPASANMTVKLADDSVQLEGVVVTALGITRDKKSLGYSAQKVDGDAVNQVPTNNFINNLAGKVAGLEVRRNSNFGGSTNIVLRGTKSITGNNQALMVVDGVPIANSNLNNSQTASGRDGVDFGNSASDIDPNNIESITVLKGAAAAALYGSQASNGAIMITTKKGKQNSGLGISYSSTTSIGQYNKDTFVKYQKQYGQGYGGVGTLIETDVNGDGVDDFFSATGDDASYGPEFTGVPVYQWNAFVPGNPNFGQATPWRAAANDPGKFFQNSFGAVNSINITGGDDKTTFNLGLTNNYETGILPNSRLSKNTITGNFSRNLSDKLKATAFLNFTDQTTVGRNAVGYGDNLMTGFRQWWPMNVDMRELRSEYNRTGGQNITWNMVNPLGGELQPAYWNNPYWDRFQNYSSDDRTRILAGANLSYDLTKDLNLLGRVTVDASNDRQELRKAVGSKSEEFGVTQETIGSGYNLYTRNFLQTTYDFIATYDTQFSESIGGKFLAGTTFIKSASDAIEASTTGGLAAPNLYTLANSVVFVAPLESEIHYEKFGFYGQASFDFKKAIYLEGTYRRDLTTALAPGNHTYDYWSVGSSIVFSEFLKADWLNLAKLRGSFAKVGNDPAPGRPGAKINNGLIAGFPTFGNNATYVDYQKLKNEDIDTWEVGFEASLFDRRVNLDVSLYKVNSFNQVINVPQSSATGYLSSLINAGELQNKGIEVALSGYPIRTENFQWMIGVNWSKNENELIKLDEGRSNLQLASFQSGVSLNATVGQPYGTLRGTDYVYDASGNKVVDEDGYYLTETDKVLGDIQADWLAGISNRFTYKNVSFNFLIDIKKGGDLFSLDQEYGQYTGLTTNTVGNNDLGNPIRNPVTSDNTSGGLILPGVFEDGTANNIRIPAQEAGMVFGNGARPNKEFVYDASYVKLREVGLTYTFNQKQLNDSFIKGLSLSLLGTNLWIIDKNTPDSDPEAGTSSGNIQGYQSGVMPSEKVYSFNVKVNF